MHILAGICLDSTCMPARASLVVYTRAVCAEDREIDPRESEKFLFLPQSINLFIPIKNQNRFSRFLKRTADLLTRISFNFNAVNEFKIAVISTQNKTIILCVYETFFQKISNKLH